MFGNFFKKRKLAATPKQEILGNTVGNQMGMPTPKLGTNFMPAKPPPMPPMGSAIGGMFGAPQQALQPGQVSSLGSAGRFDLYGQPQQAPRDKFLDAITNNVNAGAQTQGLLSGIGRGIGGLSK